MKMKQLLAGVLSAIMIMGTSVCAFAAGSPSTEPVPAPPAGPVTPVAPYVPYVPVAPGRVITIAAPARRTAGSSTSSTTTSTTKKVLYRTESKIAETPAYKKLKETKPEITDLLDKVNAGTLDLAGLAATITDPTVAAKLANKDFVTPFFDLDWVDGVTQADKDTIKNAEGKYVVDLSIPALTEKLTGVQALHYSLDRDTFEVEDTTALDLAKKTLSVGFKDFSPVAIIADAASIG